MFNKGNTLLVLLCHVAKETRERIFPLFLHARPEVGADRRLGRGEEIEHREVVKFEEELRDFVIAHSKKNRTRKRGRRRLLFQKAFPQRGRGLKDRFENEGYRRLARRARRAIMMPANITMTAAQTTASVMNAEFHL